MNDLLEKRPRSSDRNATDIAGLFDMGVQRHQRGDLAGAWQHYEAVLARDPEHADSLHHLGIIATQTGRHELAAELICRAIAFNGRVPEFHYNIGIAFGALGQFDRAVAHNRKAVELKPDYVAALINLGKALLAQHHTGEAIDAYRRAVALAPDAPPALLGLANALADAGRLDDAVAQYRNILSLSPDDADAHNNLGTLFASQGQLDDAVSSYRQALRLNPNLAAAEFNLANALRDAGQSKEAAEHYRNAVRLNPNFAEAHNNLGSLLALDNRHAEACAAFQQAIAAVPNFAPAFEDLGQAAHATGDLALALEALTRARALDNTPATQDLLHAAFADRRALPHAPRHRELLIELMALPRDDLEHVTLSAISALESNPAFAKCLAHAPSGAAAFETGDLQRPRGRPAASRRARPGAHLSGPARALPDRDARGPARNGVAGRRRRNRRRVGAEPSVRAGPVLLPGRICLRPVGSRNRAGPHGASGHRRRAEIGHGRAPSMLMAVASYGPLHTLPDAEPLAQRPWPAPVEAIVEQQIRVPREVARVAAAIPRLTPIEDEVSQRVARQYEENPYPRCKGLRSSTRTTSSSAQICVSASRRFRST